MILAAWAAAFAAAPAIAAQPFIFSGYLEGRLGYGTNPFLTSGQSSAAGFGGFTFSPSLSRSTAVSTTTLAGSYDREQYFNRYGHTETYAANVSHRQQLSEHATVSGSVRYLLSDNPLVTPSSDAIVLVDPLSSGTRTRTLSGDANLDWTPTGRDNFNFGVNAQHSTYSNGLFSGSDYDQYGGNIGYLRTLSARTKLGVRVYYSRYTSENFSSGSSLAPSLAIDQVLSPIWKANGDIGLVIQRTDGPFSRTTTGLGFHANLCGTYPRSSICFAAARSTSGSGVGGFSRTTSASVTASHRLSERGTLTAFASYEETGANRSVLFTNARIYQGRLDYSHQLTQRLSGGVTGRYQRSDYGGFGSANAVAGTVNLRWQIGRVG